jgi:hypothetical protein
VEACARYVKGWATIPNIRCAGQYEIDLLAIDPATSARFHIESGVSVSHAFSKLTAKPFDRERLKVRGQQPIQRRTLSYFIERKFGPPEVVSKLADYGFKTGAYAKIIRSRGGETQTNSC